VCVVGFIVVVVVVWVGVDVVGVVTVVGIVGGDVVAVAYVVDCGAAVVVAVGGYVFYAVVRYGFDFCVAILVVWLCCSLDLSLLISVVL